MRVLNYNKLTEAIQSWIKNYVFSANANGVVLGLSGGIDSSVTAALCVNAIGNKNVMGLGLPCESVSQDLEDAKLIADHLRIKLTIINLENSYNQLVQSLSPYFEPNKISKANIKPRLRMISLYYVAQSIDNYLVAGTGNRSELAIGYFTKYGDGGVDFEPLGMLYKSEVKEIAKQLKLPERIIKKPPSAGLWPGQTDEGEIGISYSELDEILYRLDHKLEINDLNEKKVEKVKSMIASTNHKLKVPPVFEVDNNMSD
ncbi:MAG: NAD+ synthase [Candidatus Heimdallarchaeota archaeon]